MLAAMYRIAAAVVRQEAEVVHVCSEKNLYTLCIAWLCTELYPKCAQFFVHDMKIPVHNQLMQSVHRNFIPKKKSPIGILSHNIQCKYLLVCFI